MYDNCPCPSSGTHGSAPGSALEDLQPHGADSVSGRLDPRLLQYRLTETQFGVLETLFHLGPLSQRALAEKQLTSASNLTTVIDNLERDGLVPHRRDPADRRKTTIALTARGRAQIGRIFPGHVEAIVKELDALTGTEQAELGRLCKKLGRRYGR